MDEIAGQLGQIRDRHGPRAIASYLGTFITANYFVPPRQFIGRIGYAF